MTERTGHEHRADIDGLRAIAIIPVVLFHAGLGCPGGFIGVDVFFVISGFLICGIILRDLDQNAFSIADFWLRRARRLLPAILALFAVVLFIGWRLLFPTQLEELANQALWCLGLLANFKMRQVLGWYWAPKASAVPLLHMWSLAVEEQFYLLTPVFLLAAHRWLRNWIGWLIGLAAGASLIAACHFTRTDSGFNFYMLPTRAWELLIGCLGAWAMRQGWGFRKHYAPLAAGLGLWLVVYSIFYLGRNSGWPNLWTLVPTIGTVLILMSHEADASPTIIARVLANPLFRFIGIISYSLYLWHWPLIVFFKEYRSPAELSLLDRWSIVALSVGVAAASWRLVEQPFRHPARALRISTRPFLIGCVGVYGLLLGVAAWAVNTNGFRERFAHSLSPVVRCVVMGNKSEPAHDYDAKNYFSAGGLKINCGDASPRCVVLGDSHAMALGPVIEQLSQACRVPTAMFAQPGTPGFFAGSNTSVVEYGSSNDEKRQRDEIVKKYVELWKPELVIISGRWSWQMTSCWGAGQKTSITGIEQACSETTSWFEKKGIKVIILTQPPVLPIEQADNGPILWKLARKNDGVLPSFFEDAEARALRQTTADLLRQHANPETTIVDVTPRFQNADGSIRYYTDSGALYRDNNHLSPLGARELMPLLTPHFQLISVNLSAR